MAIKKSDLYSSLWASCNELRGGMDASQYKDYVLFLLFIKYISDKYGNSDDFAPPVTIPPGASFTDMIALKGKSDIGDKINTQIIQPLIDANARLARSDFPNFNDPEKLGEGPALVERLRNCSIYEGRAFLRKAANRIEDQAAEIERLREALVVFGGEAAIEAKQLFIRMTATPKCSRKRKELAAHHYEASRKAAIARAALAGKAEQ